MKFKVRARSLKDLAMMAEPTAVPGGQSEALAWTFFDTNLYVSAATTQLTYFTTTRANSQLSNLNGRGLPTPQYFEIYSFNLDVLSAAGNTTPLEDTWDVLNGLGGAGNTGAPTWQFVLADKVTGPFPLRGLHGLGNIHGFTTQATTEYAQNGDGTGGFWADGAIVIPPNQTFSIVVTWPAAVTLSSNLDLVASMSGVLHRRVL